MLGKIGLIIFLISVLAISVFIHEFSHVVFGKIIGLKCIGFQMWHIMFKIENKIKITFIHKTKQLGQCIFVPMSFNIKWQSLLFVFGAGIFQNLILTIIGLVGIIRFHGTQYDKYYAVLFLVNFYLFISSSVPYCVGELASDGYMIYHTFKIKNSKPFLQLMYITGNLYRGNVDGLENVLDELVDVQNVYDICLRIDNAYLLMKNRKYIEAKQIFLNLYGYESLPAYHRNYIKYELLWLAIVLDDEKLQKELLTSEKDLYVSGTCDDYAALRVRYLLDDKEKISHNDYEIVYEKLLRQDIFEGRVYIERKLWIESKLKKSMVNI